MINSWESPCHELDLFITLTRWADSIQSKLSRLQVCWIHVIQRYKLSVEYTYKKRQTAISVMHSLLSSKNKKVHCCFTTQLDATNDTICGLHNVDCTSLAAAGKSYHFPFVSAALPRRWPTGCSCAGSRRRRKCTSEWPDRSRGCPPPSSETAPAHAEGTV